MSPLSRLVPPCPLQRGPTLSAAPIRRGGTSRPTGSTGLRPRSATRGSCADPRRPRPLGGPPHTSSGRPAPPSTWPSSPPATTAARRGPAGASPWFLCVGPRSSSPGSAGLPNTEAAGSGGPCNRARTRRAGEVDRRTRRRFLRAARPHRARLPDDSPAPHSWQVHPPGPHTGVCSFSNMAE